MGAWRPKHVEWLCRNKTCTVLHQVGVSFDLYCAARKHKIKMWAYIGLLRTIYAGLLETKIIFNKLGHFGFCSKFESVGGDGGMPRGWPLEDDQSERTRRLQISSGLLVDCSHYQRLFGDETWPAVSGVEGMETGLHVSNWAWSLVPTESKNCTSRLDCSIRRHVCLVTNCDWNFQMSCRFGVDK